MAAVAAGLTAALAAPAAGTLGFVFYESWGYSASLLNLVKGLGSGGVFLALALVTGMVSGCRVQPARATATPAPFWVRMGARVS